MMARKMAMVVLLVWNSLFEKKLIHKKDTANANAEPAAKAVTKPEKEGK